jgi:hypothetical protein
VQVHIIRDRGPCAIEGTRRGKFLPTWDYLPIISGRPSCDVLLSTKVTGGPPGVLMHTRWGGRPTDRRSSNRSSVGPRSRMMCKCISS